jgi:type II secretory pathway component PulF
LFAIAAVAVHFIATVFSVVGLMIFGPRCEKVFQDFNLKPDDLTMFALAVSRWLNNYWYVLAIFLVPCFVVDLIAQFLLHRWHRTRVWAYVAAVLILLLVLGCTGLLGNALYVSSTKLQERL